MKSILLLTNSSISIRKIRKCKITISLGMGLRTIKEIIDHTPKTKRSIRTIKIPDFLAEELKDCLDMYVDIGLEDRIFPFTKRFLHHEIERGCKLSGVKQIRVHDLRHSHVSLLIDRRYTALAIGKRVGHTSYKITERYSHLFPSVQDEMAEDLNNLRKGK